MGANNRGSQLATSARQTARREIAYICDCDDNAIAKGIAAATRTAAPPPKASKISARRSTTNHVDALVVAAPNHWHAPATLLGLAAGKHVYCEKPAQPHRRRRRTHDRRRQELRARSPNRPAAPQQSALHRSRSATKSAKAPSAASSTPVDVLQQPPLDRPRQANRAARLARLRPLARPRPAEPYRDNVIPYNWHLFWHWGNGEVGNNGVHTIDICRWALGVDYPTKVTASGSKLRYDDDQETPDTCNIVADFGGRTLVWEGVSWSPAYKPLSGINIELRGEDGTIFFEDTATDSSTPTASSSKKTKKATSSWSRAPRPTSSTPSATAQN